MFQSQPLVPPREADAVRHRLAALNRTADSWFDGSLGSLDARLAAVGTLLTRLRRIAARDPESELVATALALEEDQRRLSAMRTELLGNRFADQATPPRTAGAERAATPRVRRFVAVALNQFLADNDDARHDATELDIRAHHYVAQRTGTLPPVEAAACDELFRLAVAERVEPAPAPVREAAVSADFADELLYG